MGTDEWRGMGVGTGVQENREGGRGTRGRRRMAGNRISKVAGSRRNLEKFHNIG